MFKFRKPRLRISKKGKISFGGAGVSVGGKHARVNLSKSGASTSTSAGPVAYNSRRGWSFGLGGKQRSGTSQRSSSWGCATLLVIGMVLGLLGTGIRVALAQNATPTATVAPAQFNVIVVKAANLRSGPGTTFPVVGSAKPNQQLTITGKNAKGDWYQVGDGKWIAAFLVKLAIGQPPTNAIASSPSNTATSQPAATATPKPVQAQPSASVEIAAVNKKEEYFILRNGGSVDVALAGWRIVSERGNQMCNLSGVLPAGASLKIWTQQEEGDPTCGYTEPILNNSKSDPTSLYDANGQLVSRFDS